MDVYQRVYDKKDLFLNAIKNVIKENDYQKDIDKLECEKKSLKDNY